MAANKQPASPFVDAELMEGVAKFQPLSPKQFQFYMISAITRLNTQMQDLLGNGQPGRITRLAERVRRVELQCAANTKCLPRGKHGGRIPRGVRTLPPVSESVKISENEKVG